MQEERPRLSPREREVVRLACEGLTDKEIAARLGIKDSTVRTYLLRARDKTGAANRAQLGRVAAPSPTPPAGDAPSPTPPSSEA